MIFVNDMHELWLNLSLFSYPNMSSSSNPSSSSELTPGSWFFILLPDPLDPFIFENGSVTCLLRLVSIFRLEYLSFSIENLFGKVPPLNSLSGLFSLALLKLFFALSPTFSTLWVTDFANFFRCFFSYSFVESNKLY